jgi:FRG domain-containing protein
VSTATRCPLVASLFFAPTDARPARLSNFVYRPGTHQERRNPTGTRTPPEHPATGRTRQHQDDATKSTSRRRDAATAPNFERRSQNTPRQRARNPAKHFCEEMVKWAIMNTGCPERRSARNLDWDDREARMQSIDLETWEQFQEELKTRDISIDGRYLFRGQRNASWSLDTTLERRRLRDYGFLDYYRLICTVRPQIESFTGTTWGTLPPDDEVRQLSKEYQKFSLMLDGIDGTFPAYSYMAYLRHHGFPSPLLDWTRTPYVAAYFAFRNADKDKVAIYVYTERAGRIKVCSNNEAQIHILGHYVQAHKRHFLQQCEYTICVSFTNTTCWNYAPHESVFSRNDPNQDVLLKFTIPAIERIKVLAALDSYNLNAFSLFDSDEALMETMALRHIDLKTTGAEANDAKTE